VTVLDTHVWVWWVDGDPRLSDAARAAIEASDELVVSAICVWELATLERLGRLRVRPDLRLWVRRALALPRVAAQPVSAEVALAAGSLPPRFPGDPADRMIYATALLNGTGLVTADRRIARHDPERIVW
jgi:PIN domain nuclease of toxin-antitoxin system